MKQGGLERRLRGMHAPIQPIAIAILRTGALVALAVLLILGLLPAVLAAEAASP